MKAGQVPFIYEINRRSSRSFVGSRLVVELLIELKGSKRQSQTAPNSRVYVCMYLKKGGWTKSFGREVPDLLVGQLGG